MVQTWKTGPGEDFTCPHCGAEYETQIYRSPARDKDSATCDVCHKVMDSWNSTNNPIYTLKRRPDDPKTP
jgi:transcription elongation factor Elf1